MNAKSLSAFLIAGVPLVYAACGGDNLTLPSEGEPATIAVFDGNEQNGRVGSQLTKPLVVLVTDTKDRPVAGASVEFVFDDASAGGSFNPDTATTGADGQASSIVTLGTRVGPVNGHARVPVPEGTVPVETAFTAMAVSADAQGIAAVSGGGQTGAVGSELALPLVVQVSDAFGNPISGVAVNWSVTGGGSVSESSTQTGDNGQTSVTRRLGNTAGPQTTLAAAEGLVGSPVTFDATATAGNASSVVKISGDVGSAPAGSVVALVVEVRDANANPISGAPVTWLVGEGGGVANPPNNTTDGQGRASTSWTLGSSPAINTLNVVSSGGATTKFTVTGTAGSPSASRSTVSASPGSIIAGVGTSTITVRVKDANGASVSGVVVSVTSSGTDNQISPATATSGNDGVATFSFGSTVAENKTITATAGGVTLNEKATVTVQKAGSTTRITSDDDDPSLAGQSVRVEFTVTGTGGTPSGNVTVTVSGGPETCTGAVSVGFCDITLTVTGNRRVITASYSGDARFAASSDTENHRVDPVPSTNQPPVANDDAYTTTSGVGFHVPGTAGFSLIANDTDPDFDDLFTVPTTIPTTSGGSVTIGDDGSFDYTPPAAPFSGTDTFDYTVTDRVPGTGGLTDTGTVTITITP